jgi:hypothetical protein
MSVIAAGKKALEYLRPEDMSERIDTMSDSNASWMGLRFASFTPCVASECSTKRKTKEEETWFEGQKQENLTRSLLNCFFFLSPPNFA